MKGGGNAEDVPVYLSDEDEKVWAGEAQRLSVGGDGSLSRLATAALREHIAQRDARDEQEVAINVSMNAAEHKTVTHGKIRSLMTQFGRDRVAIAYARAVSMEALKHSRAGYDSAATEGTEPFEGHRQARRWHAKGEEGR